VKWGPSLTLVRLILIGMVAPILRFTHTFKRIRSVRLLMKCTEPPNMYSQMREYTDISVELRCSRVLRKRGPADYFPCLQPHWDLILLLVKEFWCVDGSDHLRWRSECSTWMLSNILHSTLSPAAVDSHKTDDVVLYSSVVRFTFVSLVRLTKVEEKWWGGILFGL
jgi:hypothetical protein